MVMTINPVRKIDLVAPLAQNATDMHIKDTNAAIRDRSDAVTQLIGNRLRPNDVDSANELSTSRTLTMPGIRISTMATRITTTRTTISERVPSADETIRGHADFSFEELINAYIDCRASKRNSDSALAFEQNLERNLCGLYKELKIKTYYPGRSICFIITRPKPREVWAADFRDRIVHHLLYNRIAPRFYASFISDSCACIPGRGTLYGVKRLESKVRSITENWSKPAYYLKMDIANFFVSIDKCILRNLISKRVTESYWLSLAELILFHDPRDNYELRGHNEKLNLVPSHKRLINQSSDKGLPIGNLSSQFFANIYLDKLDQFIKHKIGAKYYIRYVDDFILLHHSAQWINAAREKIIK
jgi:hypothetical protein